jgi:hypothetical protein
MVVHLIGNRRPCFGVSSARRCMIFRIIPYFDRRSLSVCVARNWENVVVHPTSNFTAAAGRDGVVIHLVSDLCSGYRRCGDDGSDG